MLSHYITISFTREELLDIRQHTPDIFSSFFVYSDALFDVLVRGAAVLVKRTLRWKRGKRRLSSAKVASELRSQAFIWQISDPFLTKQMNYFSWPVQTRTFLNSAALCFTETWLSEAIPDNVLPFPGYQLFRADCITELNNGEKEMWWIMFLHKGRLVFRRNNSEEDLLS